MGRKRKTRWRRLSIGEISANEDEDGELGVAVISLTRSHSHSASQNHSPARQPSDKALITMTNNNKDSTSSPSLHNSSTNLSSPGSGGNTGGGPTVNSGSNSGKILSSSSSTPNPDKAQIPAKNSSSSSSPNPHSQSNNSGYHNSHHNHVPSYNNATHPPPNSVSSNESGCSSGSASSSTGGSGGGHYNDRYHYTRENYRPPHHHHHHHSHNHHSNYNNSSTNSQYQGGAEGASSSRSERGGGGSYHYSSHPHGGPKDYQNGYGGGPSHYSGYQGSTYYRNSHNNYRNSHYNGGGGGASGGEPYNGGGGETEGYHYPPSSRPYGGGRFRKSRTYPASSYYYANGSSKSSGGASNNTSDNINRPSYNQDEYTKITTPRQDVLFKKGYLSQKKTQPSSSSVDSASAATTPSASTNGTPDTQSTNGINSDNSEGYENGETDYVIPYDDTIYYAPTHPPEAMFTDPSTGQVYYGHCSSTGEYYDAYPVSPVMVAAGYPPVYYPMVPYAPIDWNGVPAPMYPMIAAPAAPPLPQIDDPSLLSPGLQGLESSPATTTNPNTNSDTTSPSSATAAGAVATTTIAATPSTTSTPAASATAPMTVLAEGANTDSVVAKEVIGTDSGIDCGSSVGDGETSSAANSQGCCSGAEEECGGGPKSNKQQRQVGNDDQPNPRPKQTLNKKKESGNGGIPLSDESVRGKGREEDNNNEGGGGKKQYEIVKGVEKLNLISKDKDEYSSSESVLSSSASSSGKASPPTIACKSSSQPIGEHSAQDTPAKTMEIDASTLSYSSPPNNAIANSPPVVKNMTGTVISSQHPHLTTTTLAYPVATVAGPPHPQAIPVAAAPVMTTVPIPVGCPPVMIAATPTGMPLPPLVPATPIMHPMSHPQQPSCPGHHHHHNNIHHVPLNSHNQHHHHLHHHPPPQHPHHQQHHSHGHGPPPHHSNYPHHNHHPRHHGPPHPHHNPHHQPQQQQQQQQPHHNSPHHHQQQQHHHHQQQQQQQHHHMAPPAQTQPLAQTAPPPVQIGSAQNIGPPPGSTPYHVYPHPTAYVYGPPVYNDEGSITEASKSITTSTTTTTTPTDITNLEGSKDLITEENNTTAENPSKEEKNKAIANKSVGMGEDGETYYDKSSTAKTQQTTTTAFPAQVETSPVTGSEVTQRSCDSKLENIIASKEFAPDNTKPATTTTAESKGAVVMLPTKTSSSTSSPIPLLYSAEENEEVGKAAASLTLESLDKMNKEIEIRPLKQDMSGTEETEKVVGTGSPPLPLFEQEQEAEAKVTNGSNAKTERNGEAKAAAALASSFSSSSSPSSTNESSTSSPVNEGTSLMRSQSKLASRKNFANDDDDDDYDAGSLSTGGGESSRETCASNNKGKNNSRKKQKQSSNKSNKNNKTKPEMNDSLNLLENDRDDKKKKQEEGENGEEKEENNKKSSAEDTSQDEQGSQNQMTSSSDSSHQTQETCSSSSTSSPQEAEGIHTSLLNSSSLTTKQNIGGEMNLPISSSSSASKKPDLTVQCPAANVNDDGQYEALQLQTSPSLANEPSSPDSLNTNQSVAGSEIAPGENLSVSESDLMNRTTSIDEVEEDLPQEAEYVVGSEQEEVALSSNSFSSEPLSKNLTEIHTYSLDDSLAATESEETRLDAGVDENNVDVTTSHENLSTNVKQVPGTELNMCHAVELESEEKSNVPAAPAADDASGEEAIRNSATSAELPLPPPLAPPCTSAENGEREDGEVPLRPQSITLAVTEWLKTQGEDALTPITIARASSSDEFEGDVEETTDSDDDEDYKEEEDDGDGRVRGKKRDDKASNLEQNQKNVYGNPWAVAPSNKSGSSNKVATTNRRRSGSKKSAMKENEGSRTSLPKSDGVCSRVAPLLSTEVPLTTTSLDRNCISNNNNKYTTSAHISSTCSTATSDDQDEVYVTDAMKPPAFESTTNKRDKHCNSNCKATPSSSISYLEVTFKTAERDVGKDYDSGLELSSPENFSSSSSAPNNTKATAASTVTNNNTNATYNKSKELAESSLSSSIIISASAATSGSIKEKKCERPALPKLITNHHHNTYTSPNPDQIVIAAPLSIHKDSAFNPAETNERRDSEPEKSDLSSSSTRNNTAPTSPSSVASGANNALASPASFPSSSIDERDHAEICDPQKYAKYYQFGVVFDTSDDPDQGIESAAEEEEETDSLDDITLDSPSAATPTLTTTITTASIMGPEQRQHQQQKFHGTQQQKNDIIDAFHGTQRTKKVAKNGKKKGSSGEEEKSNDVLVSKSVYLPDEDEEIGTFDPKLVLESRLRRASSSAGDGGGKASDSFDSTASAVDALDYVGETLLVAAPTNSSSTSSSDAPSSHFYVNPLSLAAELSGSELVKVAVNKNEEETSSFDSLDESPLPPYESPPSVEIPVYNANTPAARVIRQNFYAIGDPVSGAICCSIQ